MEERRKVGNKKFKAFIVHGWDNELKLEVKNYFQNILNIECIVLHEQDGEGDVLLNKFEKFAQQSSLSIILLSDKDEKGVSYFSAPDAVKRPRPNVLFEMGYFYSLLGRKNVVVLKRGNVEMHSHQCRHPRALDWEYCNP